MAAEYSFKDSTGLDGSVTRRFRTYQRIVATEEHLAIAIGTDYGAYIVHEWKTDSAGRTALLIDGARRVGKSYIAEAFAKAEYKSYILIDFNNTGDNVLDLFKT